MARATHACHGGGVDGSQRPLAVRWFPTLNRRAPASVLRILTTDVRTCTGPRSRRRAGSPRPRHPYRGAAMMRRIVGGGLAVALSVAMAACGGDDSDTPSTDGEGGAPKTLTVYS